MADASGRTTYTHDALNRLATQVAGAKTVTYSCDAVGNRAVLLDPDGGRTTYTYDEVNRPCAAGMTTLAWNGVSDLGTRVPSGTYLVCVEVCSPEGGQAQSMAGLTLRR